MTAKAIKAAILASFIVPNDPVKPNGFFRASLIFLLAIYKAMIEKIRPIPPKQALIKLINERTKIGVVTKRVFID